MEFKSIIAEVARFHDAFGIQNNHKPTAQLTHKDVQLRFDLMKEENEEYLEAAKNGDIVEIADALGYMQHSTVQHHMGSLRRLGWVRWTPRRHNTLEFFHPDGTWSRTPPPKVL
jgi:hypothetical protein